jgi:hypothetical protein
MVYIQIQPSQCAAMNLIKSIMTYKIFSFMKHETLGSILTWYVGGNFGEETGVQSYDLIILSASKKFRNRLATNRSCRNSF